MEDLIEIKTKKEQTMTDLEKLKSEIVKNKTFLESLKKINLREETQVSSPSAARFEEVKHIENKSPANPVQQYQDNNTKSPEPRYRAPQIQEVLEKHLPDLVNHEKTVFNENNVHTKVSPEHLRHLNLSQDYLKHLQRIQENGNTSVEHPKYAERTPPPPQLYNKQVHVNQNKVATIPENQINHQAYASNNLRPPSFTKTTSQSRISNSKFQCSFQTPQLNLINMEQTSTTFSLDLPVRETQMSPIPKDFSNQAPGQSVSAKYKVMYKADRQKPGGMLERSRLFRIRWWWKAS